MNKIVFTGGGTAGHVTPNLAVMAKLRERGWEIHYIGSRNGIEREIVEHEGVPFHPIASGKLRRYFDLKKLQRPFPRRVRRRASVRTASAAQAAHRLLQGRLRFRSGHRGMPAGRRTGHFA